MPHVVCGLAVEVRKPRAAMRAFAGCVCELRWWDVVQEGWVVWGTAPMAKVGDGWVATM